MSITILPLPGVPDVEAGDDLAELILAACERAGVRLRDEDVVCVAQKVVSKSEGATVELPDDEPPEAARRRIARDRAARIVADTPHVLIVETHHGLICANAGIDASNMPPGTLGLLPEDPDASARRLVDRLGALTGATVGVIVTDTFGRPWRMGQTDVAIGVAGVAPLRDERGGADMSGRTLDVTVVAVADELAAAADLARRKADGTPFVVVRGAEVEPDTEATVRDLLRPAEEDLFRTATPPQEG